MTERYEIRVSNCLGPVLLGAFSGMRAVVVPRQTVIEGWLTADEFRALLLRVERVGVQLVHLDCSAGGRHRPIGRDSPARSGYRSSDPPKG